MGFIKLLMRSLALFRISCTHATAVRVNHAPPDHRRCFGNPKPSLGSGDGFPIENDPDLAAQQIEQDRNAVAIRQSFK